MLEFLMPRLICFFRGHNWSTLAIDFPNDTAHVTCQRCCVTQQIKFADPNDPCPCASGHKYLDCCAGFNDEGP